MSRTARTLTFVAGALGLALVGAPKAVAQAVTPAGPAITITSPAPTTPVAGSVRLAADVADPQGVLRVHFYVDGTQVGVDSNAPYETTWDAAAAAAGAHPLRVIAFDASPERSKSEQRATLTTAVAPTPAEPAPEPSVLWRGDQFCSRTTLHTGVGHCPATGPWDVAACVGAPAGTPIWSLRDEPAGVGRFEVRQGDRGALSGGDRCELVQQTRSITGMAPAPGQAPMPGGEVRVFSFDTMYDASTQLPSRLQYQTVAQWHHSTQPAGCSTASPLKIAIAGPAGAKRLEVHEQECLRGVSGPRRILLSVPLITGTWQGWQFEIKWSTDPSIGYVRFWHDGRLVAPTGCAADGRCMLATRYSDANGAAAYNHFKVGNYRDPSIAEPTVVLFRNVEIRLAAGPGLP